jgi:hypothetical protein
MSNTGARCEIAIDGTPRSYRDRNKLAIKAATFLKTKKVHSEVSVRDLGTGETIAVKHPLEAGGTVRVLIAQPSSAARALANPER